jgi:hypothetical protein
MRKKSTPSNTLTPNQRALLKAARDRERRAKYLDERYGLALIQVEAQAHAQGDLCAVCGQPETDERSPRLKVDYDRATGTLVGMLCLRCLQNVNALRCFNADPKMQLLANIYIDNSQHSS